jgi:hypothetical protein
LWPTSAWPNSSLGLFVVGIQSAAPNSNSEVVGKKKNAQKKIKKIVDIELGCAKMCAQAEVQPFLL